MRTILWVAGVLVSTNLEAAESTPRAPVRILLQVTRGSVAHGAGSKSDFLFTVKTDCVELVRTTQTAAKPRSKNVRPLKETPEAVAGGGPRGAAQKAHLDAAWRARLLALVSETKLLDHPPSGRRMMGESKLHVTVEYARGEPSQGIPEDRRPWDRLQADLQRLGTTP